MRTGRPRLDQPCPYPGRGGSGLCATHYKALWQRTRRLQRLMGTDLTLAAICDVTSRLRAQDALAEEVLGVLHRLMRAVRRGTPPDRPERTARAAPGGARGSVPAAGRSVTRPRVAGLVDVLRPGQVLFVRRRGFLGWLIRRVTKAEYNHVALVSQAYPDVWITVEAADMDGVKALRLEAYLEDQAVTALLLRDSSALTADERAAIMRVAWLMVGRRYDTLQLLGIYARRRLPWLFGGEASALSINRLDSADRLICSELVTVAYKRGARVDLTPKGVAIGNVDPSHLAATGQLVDVWRWTIGEPRRRRPRRGQDVSEAPGMRGEA